MNELLAVLRDPRVSTLLALAATVGAGFAALALGWRGVAGLASVARQVPFLMSAGFIGMALVGAGLTLLVLHLDRVEAAQERVALAGLQRDALRLLGDVTYPRER